MLPSQPARLLASLTFSTALYTWGMNAPRPPDVVTILPRVSSDLVALSGRVRLLASRHGLAVSAITSVDPFPETTTWLERQIDAGHLQGLDWFTKERAQIAADVRNLQPTARSIVSVGIPYWPGPTDKPDDGVTRSRIFTLRLGTRLPSGDEAPHGEGTHAELESALDRAIDARFLVDTARIVDRAVAARAGLGWYGKHANLIVPGHGSWVLLGEMLLDIDLEPDQPLDRNCGRCTICLDRCPTGAIVDPYVIDAPRCISYLTIELHGEIPRQLRPQMGDWVYGCDVCQEVCPYTGAAATTDDADLQPASIDNAWPDLHWLLRMTEAEFGATYHGTPVPRTKRRGLARNAAVALGNIGTDADIPSMVEALTGHDEPLVRGHAAWALGRLGGGTAITALDRARSTDPDESVRGEATAALA